MPVLVLPNISGRNPDQRGQGLLDIVLDRDTGTQRCAPLM